MKAFGWGKNSNFMQGLKSAILAIFRMGWNGHALLVTALKSSSQKFKNYFCLGFLESRKAKLKGPILSGFNLVKEQCDVTWLKVFFYRLRTAHHGRNFQILPKKYGTFNMAS